MIGKRKYRNRKGAPRMGRINENTVNCCITDVDIIGMRGRRKHCAARPQGKGRNADNKIRTVGIKIAGEDNKKCYIVSMRKREKETTVS